MVAFKILFYSLALLLILAFVVFRLSRYRKKKYEYYLLLILVVAFFWVFCNALYDTILNPEIVLFFVKFAMLPGVFLVNLFYLFSLHFPKEKELSWKTTALVLLPSVLIGIQSFSSWNVLSVEVTKEYRNFQGGFLYFELFFNVVLFFSLSIRQLILKSNKAKNEIFKRQLRGILLTVVLSFPVAIVSNIVFIIYNLPSYVFLGQFATIIFILGISYVTIRYDVTIKKKKSHYLFLYFFPLFFVILFFLVFILLFKNSLSFTLVSFSAIASIAMYGVINYFFVLRESEIKLSFSIQKQDFVDRKKIGSEMLNYETVYQRLKKCQLNFFGSENCQLIIKDRKSFNIFPTHYDSIDFKMETFWEILSHVKGVFYSDREEVFLEDKYVDENEEKMIYKILSFFRQREVKLIYPIYIGDDLIGAIIMNHEKKTINEKDILKLEAFLSDLVFDISKIIAYKKKEQSRKELEKEVLHKTKDLKLVNRKLSELLQDKVALSHMINHQIRGPLTNVTNYLSFFKNGIDGLSMDDRELYMKKVINSADQLKKTTHDLLLLLSLEEEHVCVEAVAVDLKQVCLKFIEQFKIQFEKRGLVASLKNRGNDFVLYSNKVLVEEVFQNLFENIFHYSDSGEVKVSLLTDDDKIRFTVENSFSLNGEKGENFIGKVISRFERGKSAMERNPEGTGLGIPIVKRIIERGGGEFEVRVENGRFQIKIVMKK